MKLAIYGYGNIGRGVEAAVRQNPDMTLTGVYTRRDPSSVKTKTGVPVYAAADIGKHKRKKKKGKGFWCCLGLHFL